MIKISVENKNDNLFKTNKKHGCKNHADISMVISLES